MFYPFFKLSFLLFLNQQFHSKHCVNKWSLKFHTIFVTKMSVEPLVGHIQLSALSTRKVNYFLSLIAARERLRSIFSLIVFCCCCSSTVSDSTQMPFPLSQTTSLKVIKISYTIPVKLPSFGQ